MTARRRLPASTRLAWTAALCARYRVAERLRRTANALVPDPVWLQRPRPVVGGSQVLSTVHQTSERRTVLAVHHRSEVQRIATVHHLAGAAVHTLREWRREVVPHGKHEGSPPAAAGLSGSIVHAFTQNLGFRTVRVVSPSPAASVQSPRRASSLPDRGTTGTRRAAPSSPALPAHAVTPVSVVIPAGGTMRVPVSPAPSEPFLSVSTNAPWLPLPAAVSAATAQAPLDRADRWTRRPSGRTGVLTTATARVALPAAAATSTSSARPALATGRASSMHTWIASPDRTRAARSLDASRPPIAASPSARAFARPAGNSDATPGARLVLEAPLPTTTGPLEARGLFEPLPVVRTLPGQTAALSVPHGGPGRPPTGLEYVRAAAPAAGPVPDAETIRRQVEERVERTLVERVERLVARELAAESAPLFRISERVSAELSEALVLERERLGWS